MKKEIAIFAAGCFWHVQEKYDCIKGVIETEAGYVGTKEILKKYPKVNYELVCSGIGFIEAVKVVYDSTIVSYEQLLELFWTLHDPTSLDRQGNDIGDQYKSVIYYFNDEQRKKAETSKEKIQKKLKNNIVTELRNFKENKFFRAEKYHQKFNEKRGKICKI